MADQKKIDQLSKRSSSTYIKGIQDIVSTLLKTKKDMTNEEFGLAMLSLDMKEVVAEKLKDIKTDYVAAHVEILKDKKPIGQVKND